MKNILELTLSAFSVKHTKSFVTRVYEDDPDRDNMLGLSRMLRLFGVETNGYMCDDYKLLLKENKPFIAVLGKSFSLVSFRGSNMVKITDLNGEFNKTLSEFLELWTGAVLLIENHINASEPDIDNHIRMEREESIKKIIYVSSVSISAFLVIYNLVGKLGIGGWIFLALNIVASFLCAILALKQFHRRSKIGDRICDAFIQEGCSSILDSKVAYPILSISLSEIGLGYFIADTLMILILPKVIPFLVITSLCSVMISVWSVCYQLIIKKWCPICLLVQFCVVLRCLVVLFFSGLDAEALGFWWLFVVYPISILSVHGIVMQLVNSSTDKEEIKRIKTIIADSDIFDYILKRQRYFGSAENSSIVIGNPKAHNTITIFSNPHCRPCAEIHRMASSLLKRTDNIKVEYVFAAFTPELERDSKFLISCFYKDREAFGLLLDKWFVEGIDNPTKFVTTRGGYEFGSIVENEYVKHSKWAHDNHVDTTPTILVNGFLLPKNYSIMDLEYIDFE